MNISTHIQDLLYRYECVVLPGFGAFLSQKQSAYIDSESNEFFPPNKVISFNRQLIKNDGLLANYIAEVESVKYNSATNMIQEFVYDLENSLQNEAKAELANIGKFYLDSEDKLQFEPFAQINFLTQSFGLDSYKTIPVNREAYKKQVEEIEEKTPLLFTPERRRSSLLKYAAIGIIALGVSGFAGLNIYSSQVSKHNIAEQQEAQTQLQQQIQQATFVIDNPLPAVTFEVEKQSGNYHVIAGAFRVEENAQTKVDELKAAGHSARLIGANKYGLHQVVYSSHQTRREAINKLYEVKRTNEGAWLLVQEF
ncbi:SPOR domain-containing protein [Christiangramia sediminis]|uniref:SPOR domain-containing protein n=1 Tax=Christiangramia sediminis TaxID=2881336 RepID=A0A9X1LK47_9FLAO|nr:SPOR domain-containing protein [Christiangramia sediminis]MCB7481853.1 SPOR domain-containing protein [Christiangramia sediminis]